MKFNLFVTKSRNAALGLAVIVSVALGFWFVASITGKLLRGIGMFDPIYLGRVPTSDVELGLVVLASFVIVGLLVPVFWSCLVDVGEGFTDFMQRKLKHKAAS